MGTFNPLFEILKDNKLTGPNFIDWKRNLLIVLTAENYRHVLTTNPPELPGATATQEEWDAYEKWRRADEMTKCYMLASMSNVLQHQHQNFPTAKDILVNVTEMFGEQNRAARQMAMKGLLNTRMSEGTPVKDHVIKMMGFINELEILGADMDLQSQIDMILSSLLESFNQYVLNYNMNNLNLSLTELMKSL